MLFVGWFHRSFTDLFFPSFEFNFCKRRVQAIVAPTGCTVSILGITQPPKPVNNQRDGARNGRTFTCAVFQPPAARLVRRAVQACLPRQDAHAGLSYVRAPFIVRNSLGCQNDFPKVNSLAPFASLNEPMCGAFFDEVSLDTATDEVVHLRVAYAHVTHPLCWICRSTVSQNRCIII